MPADLADEEQRGQAIAAVLAAGRVDILVNNAATVEPLGAEGTLITPEHSAAALLAHLSGDDTGAIWDLSTAPAGA